MLNIIRSDFFRVKKGAALKGVFIGLIGMMILLASIFYMIANANINLGDQDNGANGISLPAETEESLSDVTSEMVSIVENGGMFLLGIIGQISSSLTFFLLPLLITVFGADYSASTFRNLLSYESDRKKAYVAKLLLTLLLAIFMALTFTLITSLMGGIFYGFAGFTGELIGTVLCTLLLQIPIFFALTCLGHCLLAFTKKCSHTIAIYLVGLLALEMVLQMLSAVKPQWEWLLRLDLMVSLNMMARHRGLPAEYIVVPLVFAGIVILATFVLGMFKYQKTDFDFA